MALETAPQTDIADSFDALSIDDLRQRGTAKWSRKGDTLAAWVAEMDFPLAPVLQTALHDAIARGVTGYAPDADESGLPAACAAWLARSYGLAVEPGQIRTLPNVLHGVVLAIETFSRPGSPVVVMTPSYPPFFEAVRAAGRAVVEAPLALHEGCYTFDLASIETALRAGAGTVILCNPHNPVGRVFRRDELAALAALVEAYGARVVADEVHAPLVYPGARHICYATVSEAAALHSITLTSASKGWNLPGLKCAQIVLTNEADLAPWDGLSFLRTHGPSILGVLANRVAYEQGEEWRRQVVAYLDGNRTLLAELLARLLPRARYTAPEGTYLAWLDCRALDLKHPYDFFLQRARVRLTDGDTFGSPGHGWARLNFATSRAILSRIVQNMADAL